LGRRLRRQLDARLEHPQQTRARFFASVDAFEQVRSLASCVAGHQQLLDRGAAHLVGGIVGEGLLVGGEATDNVFEA
jgi:hypothetical protein